MRAKALGAALGVNNLPTIPSRPTGNKTGLALFRPLWPSGS
jgi:hypothetical protein